MLQVYKVLAACVVFGVVICGSHFFDTASLFPVLAPVLAPVLGAAYGILFVSQGLAPPEWRGFAMLNACSRFFIGAAAMCVSFGGVLLAFELQESSRYLGAGVGMAVIACVFIAVHWSTAIFSLLLMQYGKVQVLGFSNLSRRSLQVGGGVDMVEPCRSDSTDD